MDQKIDARVLVLNNNQILLVLEKGEDKHLPNGNSFFKPSQWGLPGGRSEVEDGDEIDTARREVQEETGLWVDINSRIKVEKQRENHLKVGFIGYPVGGKISINPEEILDCRWFPIKVLFDEKFDMYPSHRRMAQELLKRLRTKSRG